MTAGVTERVAHLEGRVQEHVRMVDDLRESMASLGQRMDARFDGLEQRLADSERHSAERFDAAMQRSDQRFDALLQRMDQRFENVEQRMDRRFDGVDRRFEAMDAKFSRQFYWVVGLQLTTLTAIVTALVAR